MCAIEAHPPAGATGVPGHARPAIPAALLALDTTRLRLRPFRAADAAALYPHCRNWNIASMTSRMPHPYTDGEAERWIAGHEPLRRAGAAFHFCVTRADRLTGSVELRAGEPGVYALGYWIAEDSWGRGFATEAAGRAIAFAFDALGAARVVAGHYLDNAASARVLEKCGFRYTHTDGQWCQARHATVACRRYALDAAAGAAAGAGTAEAR